MVTLLLLLMLLLQHARLGWSHDKGTVSLDELAGGRRRPRCPIRVHDEGAASRGEYLLAALDDWHLGDEPRLAGGRHLDERSVWQLVQEDAGGRHGW